MKLTLLFLSVITLSYSKTVEHELEINRFYQTTDFNITLEKNDIFLIKIIGDFLNDKPILDESSVNFNNITMINKTFKQNSIMKNGDFIKITNSTFELKFKYEGYYEIIIKFLFGRGSSKENEYKFVSFKVNVNEIKPEEKEENSETKKETEEKNEDLKKEEKEKTESESESESEKKDIKEELLKLGKEIFQDLKDFKIIG